MDFLRRILGHPEDSDPPSDPPPLLLKIEALIVLPDQDVWLEVRGESFHQGELHALAGPKTIDGPTRPTGHTAILLAKPHPRDSSAVVVQINALNVGYLPRELAWTYLPALELAARAGKAVACEAVITGGWDRGADDEGHFGVMLRLGSAADVEAELQAAGYRE